MRILVTGGAGFIGSHVADFLTKRGDDVLVIDNLRTGSIENLHGARATGRLRIEVIDLLDAGQVDPLVSTFQPDAIVHLAALVSVQEARREPDENFRLNVEATQRVISAANRSGARRIVFASSAAVYGDNPAVPLRETEPLAPLSLYGAAKAASELLLLSSARDLGFDAIALRFFNVFGPRQRPDSPYSGVISIFVDRIARGLPIKVFGDGRQSRDFVSVHDVVRAICGALDHPERLSGTFNVCTGRQTSLLDLIGAIKRTTGQPVSIEFQSPRVGDIVHSLGSPALLAAATGTRAVHPLDAALAEICSFATNLQADDPGDRHQTREKQTTGS